MMTLITILLIAITVLCSVALGYWLGLRDAKTRELIANIKLRNNEERKKATGVVKPGLNYSPANPTKSSVVRPAAARTQSERDGTASALEAVRKVVKS